ncbi:hypothetical protein MJO29_006721, partial [Puccinia striiformis f. sp. tritici]
IKSPEPVMKILSIASTIFACLSFFARVGAAPSLADQLDLTDMGVPDRGFSQYDKRGDKFGLDGLSDEADGNTSDPQYADEDFSSEN